MTAWCENLSILVVLSRGGDNIFTFRLGYVGANLALDLG